MGFFKKAWGGVKRIAKPVFNPVKSVASQINEKLLNPVLIKPFEKADDMVDNWKGLSDFPAAFSKIVKAQMLGLPDEQVLEAERSRIQKFLELKASPKFTKIASVGQLADAIGRATKDMNENLYAMRLAKESGALGYDESNKKFVLPEGVDTFKQYMQRKAQQELESKKTRAEDIQSVISRVQEKGVAKQFTPQDTSFNRYLAQVQGQPQQPQQQQQSQQQGNQ